MSDHRPRGEENILPESRETEGPKNPPVEGLTDDPETRASQEAEPPPPPPDAEGPGTGEESIAPEHQEVEGPKNPPVQGVTGPGREDAETKRSR